MIAGLSSASKRTTLAPSTTMASTSSWEMLASPAVITRSVKPTFCQAYMASTVGNAVVEEAVNDASGRWTTPKK